jgi:hypothetical protein
MNIIDMAFGRRAAERVSGEKRGVLGLKGRAIKKVRSADRGRNDRMAGECYLK